MTIWEHYTKKNLTFEERESIIWIMNIIEAWHAKGRQANVEFHARFVREIPPGTVVWEDNTMRKYGTTYAGMGAGIYSSAANPFVTVTEVNGLLGTQEVWQAENVIKKI